MSRLTYPENIVERSRDYIKFEFGEYKSPFRSDNPNRFSYVNEIPFTATGDPVFLPMPNEIGSNFGGNWGGKDLTGVAQAVLGSLGKVAGNALLNNTKSGGLQDLFTAEGVKAVTGATAQDLTNFATNFAAKFPGMGANLNVNDILQLSTESITNPNTELLYSGAGLRQHGYSFKMVPRSATEADMILKIVERFKKACAPKQNSAVFGGTFRNFIGIPDLCKVSYIMDNGTVNPHLPLYKTSGITSVNVGYVTENQYVSYTDGKPLGVTLTVALTETKLVFSEEIGTVAR